MLASDHQDTPGTFLLYLTGAIFALSSIPALIALGQSTAAIRVAGDPSRKLAGAGLALSGLQVGFMVGIVLLNLWHN